MHLDPGLFDEAAIDAETLAFIDQIERELSSGLSVMEVPPAQTRAARERGEGFWAPPAASPRAQDLAIRGPGGHLMLRVIPPQADPIGAYLHFHGGGWVFGSARHQDLLLEEMADLTGLVIASVEYRLAPEDPYPAAADDAEAAALWLADRGASEFGTDRLVIGGESAGANLSVGALVRLRERHDCRVFVAANLVSGVFDLTMTPSLRNWGDRNLVINTRFMEWFVEQYTRPGHDLRDPDISPLYADLDAMPPALFTIGTMDPLIDDTVFMAARWAAAGLDSDLAVYPGGIHTFWYFDTALARKARHRIAEFLADAVGSNASDAG
jgi:acetyl esterase/lipase